MTKHKFHFHDWMIVTVAVLVSSLELIDSTVASVALTHIQGALSASPEGIGWVMTSYLIASSIALPLTGFFISKCGRKRALKLGILGFTITSLLCGFSSNLGLLILWRSLQGFFGAPLMAISQAVIADHFSDDGFKKSMSIYGTAIMGAPVLGPILGGWITLSLDWRWIFFVNLPLGLLGFILIQLYLKKDKPGAVKKKVDFIGLLLMAASIFGLLFVLNEGQQYDWFSSKVIQVAMEVTVILFVVFIIRGIKLGANHIVNFSIFTYPRFIIGTLLLMAFALCLTGITTWLPTLVEQLFHYPTISAGLLLAPRGLVVAVTSLSMPWIMRKVSAKWLTTTGFVLSALACYQLAHVNLAVSQSFFIEPMLLLGVATGLFFLPTSQLALGSVPSNLKDTSSGLFMFSRTMGMSFGVTLFTVIMLQQQQVSWHHWVGYINLTGLRSTLWSAKHGLLLLHNRVGLLASTVAYQDVFYAGMLLCMGCAGFAFVFA